ncbi:DsbA family protein [Hymenobacter negativus]|uniref:DsbA family protein n=1 Tax=Hymenobacter negativus TaxID=2795026 RepID=A0ABS0Q413_9BACT|nr:DsbA family protein [Hymenobacter negativus]MBH8557399.1 DsbA family protein [Hymenobacter negativus]
MEHSVELPASLNPPPARPVLLECYTDPLCPQSAAFEQHGQRLRADFGHRFAWRYRLRSLPASSYPACLAVKCAERQSAQAGELYLRAVRAAVTRQGHHAACPATLAAVAAALAAQFPAVFDAAVFRQDMAANAGEAALLEDAQQAHRHHIRCWPSLVVVRRGPGPGAVLTGGSQPYEALLQALAALAPDVFYEPSLVDGGAG